MELNRWAGQDGSSDLQKFVLQASERMLRAYEQNPELVKQDVGIEENISKGGYERRQVYELVQNAADAIQAGGSAGRVEIVLTPDALYCANSGSPVDNQGAQALLLSYMSSKSGAIGHFGVGFKCVLQITDSPEVLTTSGSFRFDKEYARRRISEVAPGFKSYPVLRVAMPLDPYKHDDPTIASMLHWATTIVRMPLRDATSVGWLSDELDGFPSRFLLFSPHVAELVISHPGRKTPRVVGMTEVDEFCRELHEDGDSQTWHVFSAEHHPSAEALQQAGQWAADRESIPVQWAVNPRRATERGAFWMFYPTTFETTLTGVLNAPWKTNDDRTNLEKGVFNDELMLAGASLVVNSLGHFDFAEDPGLILDIIPARGDEAAQWADKALTALVYEAAENARVIPDQDGNLQPPSAVRLPPSEVTDDMLLAWSRIPGRPAAWCHPSVRGNTRRSRARRMIPPKNHAGLVDWLEALVFEKTPTASANAVLFAASMWESGSLTVKDHESIRDARILLTSTGGLVRLSSKSVLLRQGSAEDPDLEYVHADLEANDAVVDALRSFGVAGVDDTGLFRSFLAASRPSQLNWHRFWELTRNLDAQAVIEILNGDFPHILAVAKGMMRSNEFGGLRGALLPGEIADGLDPRDAAVVLDTEYHADDSRLLELLGLSAAPSIAALSVEEVAAAKWFGPYDLEMRGAYKRALGPRQNPQQALINYETTPVPRSLEVLQALSPAAAARYASAALRQGTLRQWTLRHDTQDRYPALPCPNPAVWLIRNHGYLETTTGSVNCSSSVGPSFADLGTFLPVAKITVPAAEALGLVAAGEEIPGSVWEVVTAKLDEVQDLSKVEDFLDLAVGRMPVPARFPCVVGLSVETRPISEIILAQDRRTSETLASQSLPHILVDRADLRTRLVERWSFCSESAVTVRWTGSGPRVRLLEDFPALETYLPADLFTLELQRCAELSEEIAGSGGTASHPCTIKVDRDCVYWVEYGSDRDLLRDVSGELQLALDSEDIALILGEKETATAREFATRVLAAKTPLEKIRIAFSEDELREGVPSTVIQATESYLGRPLDHAELSNLTFAVHGVDVLHELRGALSAKGVPTPGRWAGGYEARRFVETLGFDAAFSGFERPERKPMLCVDGPLRLPPLHEFQRKIADEVKSMFRPRGKKRGLVWLPTGAGKTRTAVEALIELWKDGALDGPVLWVAQTDELCEQAVQTFSKLWRAIGPEHQLIVSRLWSSNQVEPAAQDAPQVVVSTLAKMYNVVKDARYQWLQAPSCLIIDEAHEATGPSYTELLDWAGFRKGRRSADSVPMIGLTATPFRSGEKQTEVLAKRFNRNLIGEDALGENPYAQLQEMGVLAQVEWRVLPGAEIAGLTADELREMQWRKDLPDRIYEKLAVDAHRNRALVKDVTSLDASWPVLLFAASVSHAQAVAALLNLEGISAAAVSAYTGKGARAHYVEEFKTGRLRVLCNYGVFKAGFDVPGVRALYVARPTFSLVNYQQMIGRGLRGPVNGGTESCLIVNVEDNVRQFGEGLAFRGFEENWGAGT